jgi:UDP-2-acetamido-2,6-beta-L-arabino-hexul-4-ose reductase
MKAIRTILITGANGFLGRNLFVRLNELDKYVVYQFDKDQPEAELFDILSKVDIIFHLAGVNRPKDPGEFQKINYGLTERMLGFLNEIEHYPIIILSSSTQAEMDNDYGRSKKNAENILNNFCKKNNSEAIIYRLTNVFGKWSKPNYNSVVSTFCHNISRDLPIRISDKSTELKLIYIDDIVNSFIDIIENNTAMIGTTYMEIVEEYRISLGDLADMIYSFKESRVTLVLQDFSNELVKKMYATYISYLPRGDFKYELPNHEDERGTLTELIKSKYFGQIFVSTTKPGITRGNHYHHTKVEKFIVIKGRAVINFRQIQSDKILSYEVSGDPIAIVDIPTGYTHEITNVGEDELVVLFWSDEVFDKNNPDTVFLKV